MTSYCTPLSSIWSPRWTSCVLNQRRWRRWSSSWWTGRLRLLVLFRSSNTRSQRSVALRVLWVSADSRPSGTAELKLELPDFCRQNVLNVSKIWIKNEIEKKSTHGIHIPMWTVCILSSLQAPDPLAEITFWQERTSTLNVLSDQLKHPLIVKILDVMTKVDSSVIQSFERTTAELRESCVESNDNLQFLSTLERHFRVIIL